MRAPILAILIVFTSLCGKADTLVSLDWKNSQGVTAHGTYSGVEPLAAASNSAFAEASVWNDPMLGYLSPVSNPSFSNLLDSTGAATGIGFQFSGQVDTYTGTDGSCPNTLFCDFIYLNAGSLDWTITGLTPGAVADLYFYNYGSANQGYRVFNMALDTDGNGTLDGAYTVQAVNGVYAASIVASASGTITGQMQCCLSGQASWSGIQINEEAPTPEPATFWFVGVGLSLFCLRRNRRLSDLLHCRDL